jgi:hypothetical protein
MLDFILKGNGSHKAEKRAAPANSHLIDLKQVVCGPVYVNCWQVGQRQVHAD